MKQKIQKILSEAENTLKTAKHGYEDFTALNKKRRFSGLRNLIVFGRSVTFVLQNLKTPVGEKDFNDWYLPIQEEMKTDPLMKYFVNLRNDILKKGSLPQMHIKANINYTPELMAQLGTPPPNTKSFFMGDQTGGSGWEVQMSDGATEKYYIDIPENMGKIEQYFSELPIPEDHTLKDKPIEKLCEYYLAELESTIDNAKKTFLE